MVEHGHLDHALPLAHADHGREVADPLRGEAPTPDGSDGGHPRVVPAAHAAVLDQLQQEALGEHGVGEVQPGELVLMRA